MTVSSTTPEKNSVVVGVSTISNGKSESIGPNGLGPQDLEARRKQSSVMVEPPTQWRSIIVSYIILLLTGLQFSLRISSLWPYLHTLDTSAEPAFLGWLIAAFSLGQFVASPVMGFVASKLHRQRPVIAFGVCLVICGNMILCFIENMPVHTRRWAMLSARIINGLGSGTAGILRASVAQSSSSKDKSSAVSMGVASFATGMVVGPGVQAAFGPIKYPGWIVNGVHFDIYTVPGYFAALLNIFTLILLFTFFKENHVGSFAATALSKTKNPYKVLPKSDKLVICLLIWFWFNLIFCFTNGETIGSPFTMAMFNWSSVEATVYNGIVQAVGGVISVLVYMLFVLWLYGRINERATMILGMFFVMSFYIISLPWPGLPRDLNYMIQGLTNSSWPARPAPSVPWTNLTEANATMGPLTWPNSTHAPSGCQIYYHWCRTLPRVNMIQYFVSVGMLSIGFPCVNAIVAPLFARVIGPRRQERLQGLFVGSGSLGRFVGPIFISNTFDAYGPYVPWITSIFVTAFSIGLMFIFYNRLVPLDIKPKLKSGQHVKYKLGTLYHF